MRLLPTRPSDRPQRERPALQRVQKARLKQRFQARMKELLFLIDMSNLAIDRNAMLLKAYRVSKNYCSIFKKNKPAVVCV